MDGELLTLSLRPSVLLMQARLLMPRLERLTPDSVFAHRASGCRRTLMRLSDQLEEQLNRGEDPAPEDLAALGYAIQVGFALIEEAARLR